MILLIQNSYDCDGFGSWFWWLIGAFLLGALLGWLLRCIFGNCEAETIEDTSLTNKWEDKYNLINAKYESSLKSNANSNNWESKYNNCVAEKNKVQADLNACIKTKNTLSTTAATATSMAITPTFVKPEDRDNLKKIEGIGPKIEQLLFDGHIFTWETLSNTAASKIQEILDKAGPRYRVHKPASWPLQAKMAAEGKWDELNKWQDEHKGGLL